MEKIIDAVLGLIEVLVFSSIIGFSGYKGLQALHEKMRIETINTLKKPSPSLLRFTRKLTNPTH